MLENTINIMLTIHIVTIIVPIMLLNTRWIITMIEAPAERRK